MVSRANTGKVDQGGGVIWRAKDADNYYIARYNPLEQNFRLYTVKNGVRKKIADASGFLVSAGEWATLKIVHRGNHIEGWLNGIQSFNVADDTFTQAGGVGFWTKADAATSFDEFIVESTDHK